MKITRKKLKKLINSEISRANLQESQELGASGEPLAAELLAQINQVKATAALIPMMDNSTAAQHGVMQDLQNDLDLLADKCKDISKKIKSVSDWTVDEDYWDTFALVLSSSPRLEDEHSNSGHREQAE